MEEAPKYNIIEFRGELLFPGFSIYLFEIIKDSEKHFYIGMTGDNHYPSARSILHRLAGHIDLLKHSTQNQLIVGVKNLFNKKLDEDLTLAELKTLNIKLHHWPIEGFVKWGNSMNNINKSLNEYKKYKEIQQKVLALENKLIHDFETRLFNDTNGKLNNTLEPEYLSIYNAVRDIIEPWMSGRNIN